ncbi:hypothetical protein Hanom_Chr17g01560571 [Helianthus anomalus]
MNTHHALQSADHNISIFSLKNWILINDSLWFFSFVVETHGKIQYYNRNHYINIQNRSFFSNMRCIYLTSRI